jgi:hypothetical protein
MEGGLVERYLHVEVSPGSDHVTNLLEEITRTG